MRPCHLPGIFILIKDVNATNPSYNFLIVDSVKDSSGMYLTVRRSSMMLRIVFKGSTMFKWTEEEGI